MMDIKSNVISDKLELNHIKIDLNGKRLIDINAMSQVVMC